MKRVRTPKEKVATIPVPFIKYQAGALMRRAFKFATHNAGLFVVKYNGRTRVLRIPNILFYRGIATTNFLEHRIFHELFPKNSIKPIALVPVDVQTKQGVVTKWCMVSDLLKGRTIDYKRYQAWFYNNEKKPIQKPLEASAHELFIQTIPGHVFDEMEKAGIDVNVHAANIANVDG